MLVFNEGVPRSGKSYDAVKSHILPAVAAGRMVYARLNGLKHDKIAAYLKLDEETVRERLIHVPKGEVVKTFQAVLLDGEWVIPPHLQNALFVIDEVHDFYVGGGRNPLPPEVENFFALHGQNGMDGVIMTQAYKRLHAVIRARIERKNQFQKLTAVGLKGRYRQRYFVTVAPDKYERTGGDTFKYNPAIFPLYDGYAPGATNVEVYDAGGKSVWSKLARPLIIAAVVLCFAVPVISRFLHGDMKLTKTPPTPAHMTPPAHADGAKASAGQGAVAAPVKSAASPISQHGTYDTTGMPPEVAYVFEISQQARPRVSAVLESSWRGSVGIIEWREDQGHVLERMDFETLRAMGVKVEVKPYGVRISYAKQVIVATQWPVDIPGTIPQDARTPTATARATTPSPQGEPASLAPVQGGQAKAGWSPPPTAQSYVPPERTVVSPIGG